MKIFKTLLLTLTQLSLLASASAEVQSKEETRKLKESYSYDFLLPGKIDFCPGKTVRVLSVGIITRTDSGGCCGHDSEFLGSDGTRADIENHLRLFPYRTLKYDKSITQKIALSALLMEQLSNQEAVVSMCIDKFDLLSIDMRGSGRATNINFDLGYKIFVTLNTEAGKKTVLVQELSGKFDVASAHYNLYYDGRINNNGIRTNAMIVNSWPKIVENFSDLRTVSNTEAFAGLAFIKEQLSDYID